jgi:4'-phosphopantetheinyl transferase
MQQQRCQSWHLAQEFPALPHDAVHVWCVRLDLQPESVQRLEEVLAMDERERADAFRFAYLRRRYVVTRGVLRQLLATYLTADAASLRFHFSALGKPSLVERVDSTSLSFNVSHSEEIALIAAARGRELGVDIERIRAIEDADGVAEHYFCPPERDALRLSQGDSKTKHFFTYWTRKEALLKATGDGLSLPLDRVDVSTIRYGKPHGVLIRDRFGAARHLTLVDLAPAIGYTGALAVEGVGWKLGCWLWPGFIDNRWIDL